MPDLLRAAAVTGATLGLAGAIGAGGAIGAEEAIEDAGSPISSIPLTGATGVVVGNPAAARTSATLVAL